MLRSSATLLTVTINAAGCDVFPAFVTVLRTHALRGHVVKRQLFGFFLLTAVLAAVLVSKEDVTPGELHMLTLGETLEKTNHARKIERKFLASDRDVVILVNHFSQIGRASCRERVYLRV